MAAMRWCSAFLILLLLLPSAQAQVPNGPSASIGVDLQHFDYRELGDGGDVLDRETGFLPGVLLEAHYRRDAWRIAARSTFHEGSVAYTGRTNLGVPISSSTRQRILDGELSAGYSFRQLGPVLPVLYAGAANHVWLRDIQPTQTASGTPVRGLAETYRWWRVFLGVTLSAGPPSSFNWGIDVRLVRIVAPVIEIDYSGLYDNPRLGLGERTGYRLAVPMSYPVGQSAALVFEPYLESHSLGRSATAPLTQQGIVKGSVFEPHSMLRHYGILLGLRALF